MAIFTSLYSSACDCDCVSLTFRVSPLMCCCSLALLNSHVRTFARLESKPKRTAAENVVCYYYFIVSFDLPPLCHSCCLWFPSRCTCDPLGLKDQNVRSSLHYDKKAFINRGFYDFFTLQFEFFQNKTEATGASINHRHKLVSGEPITDPTRTNIHDQISADFL